MTGLATGVANRYRNLPGAWRVTVSDACINCGLCAEVCPNDVYDMVPGHRHPKVESRACLGDTCTIGPFGCVPQCPVDAIAIRPSSTWSVFGDARWSGQFLLETYHAAATGRALTADVRTLKGPSGGGFDALEIKDPPNGTRLDPDTVDLSVRLDRRGDAGGLTIQTPMYGGGMSYGSVSLNVMLSRAMAMREVGSLTCTGEGGYPDELIPLSRWVITQVATGLFGVNEAAIQRSPMIEFKYAQGAKPGLGGHLLGDKNTPSVARLREAVEGTSLFSPFPFHSVYSVEDHKKHVDWMRSVNPNAAISVKVSTPVDVDMVAIGSYYAGAHVIHLDGGYGGTGAAPDIAKKNIATPIELAIPRVHRFLEAEKVRDEVTLVASGGIRHAGDVIKSILLGADAVVLGTAELVAVECTRCGLCESGRGCPRGIATTDPELAPLLPTDYGSRRVANLYRAWCQQIRTFMGAYGFENLRQMRGRTDLLRYVGG